MEIKEIQAKSILVPSKLPDADYVINPYTGCAFGCTYCYASFMGRYSGKDIKDWGSYVFVKINAPELLRRDIKRLKDKGKGKTVFLSSVTDPYQGVEAKYKITRKCLEVLAEEGFMGKIGILTKSHMVLRDVDVFKKLNDVEVGLTITTTNDKVSRLLEKKAPNVSQRLEALTKLNDEGINTYAFVGPLLPHFVEKVDLLDELFKAIAETCTKELYVEHVNLSKYILERFDLGKHYTEKYKDYREELSRIVLDLVSKYGLKLRLDSAIYHPDKNITT